MTIHYPHYPNHKPDYTTNSNSYYEDLAIKQHLFERLSKKIWDYDKELAKRFDEWKKNLEDLPEDIKKLLAKWLQDGTFEHIINVELLGSRAKIVVSKSKDEPKHDDLTFWYEELSQPILNNNINIVVSVEEPGTDKIWYELEEDFNE